MFWVLRRDVLKSFLHFWLTQKGHNRKNISHPGSTNIHIYPCAPSSSYGIKTTSQKSSTSKCYCVWVYAKHIPFQCHSCDTASKEVGAFYPAPTRPWWQHPPVCPKAAPASKGSVLLPGPLERCQNKHQAKQCEQSSRLWEVPEWVDCLCHDRELNTAGQCQCAKKQMQPGGREGAGKKVYPSSGGFATPQASPKYL